MIDVVAQRLVRRTWDLKVESSSPGRCTHVVFLGKTLTSHNASLHPSVYVVVQFYPWFKFSLPLFLAMVIYDN